MTASAADANPDNPLLAGGHLPRFDAIRAEHVRPAVEQTLSAQRAALARVEQVENPTFAWALELERIQEAVDRVWGPVSHLNSVKSNPEFRAAFNDCLGLITEFGTDMSQNEALYKHFVELDRRLIDAGPQERRLIEHALRDFRLAGVALAPEGKARFREIMLTLAARQATFEQNLMDATDAFAHHESDRDALAGLPDTVLERAAEAAREKDLDGWLLALDPPTYQSIMTHAKSESLRAIFYEAWNTRASDRGPHAGRWDNGPLIEEILALRHEAARLLGFADFAELSLATKMAGSPAEVIDFLRDLGEKSRIAAKSELAALSAYAGRTLKAWDIAFYSERLRQERFQLAEEELRPYFPLPRVLEGLFAVAARLFDVRIVPGEAQEIWHPSVALYEVRDAGGRQIGSFFTDLFARANKRGGAWMDVCANRARIEGLEQQPIAHLVCNFTPPVGDAPSLLTHNDVVTLFHEFGHTLHHLLTEVDYPSLAGINGVAWDAVELPSQFLENYAWLPEVLKEISGQYRTGEPLPGEKIETLNRARTFLAGLAMVRQLEFALFDFRLHHEYDAAAAGRVTELLDEVRREVAVIVPPDYNRFANSFAHIFGGGYAAGYYSYKWAEVLAADAFDAFVQAGVFSAEIAQRFRRSILAVGGSRDALDAFVEFRGRSPLPEALLRQSGLVPAATEAA
jgi:oligopeptidase A